MKTKGEIYLELHEKEGKSYGQIAAMFGVTKATVGSCIYFFRKKNGIKSKWDYSASTKMAIANGTKKNGFQLVADEDREKRYNDHMQIKVRADGVKVCPTRYSEGFGINRKLLT